ncbi:MAG TPA: porin [Chitinolyticbacter sp.]|nr:porin [Chitinolyticbacter sp.]
MKKLTLTPIALALLLGSGLAQADVYIDGTFDGGVNVNDMGNQTESNVDYNATIGIGGSDQLDSGGKVKWRLEQGISNQNLLSDGGENADGTASFGGREAWIGYESAAGMVRLGKMKSPLFEALDNRYGDTGAKFLLSEYALGQNYRPDAAIRYDSPSFGGFSFSGLYDVGSGDGDQYTYDLAARYAQGGFFVDGAYQNRKNADGSDDVTVGYANEFDSQNWYVATGYQFQNGFGVNGGYKAMEYTPTDGTKVDQDMWFAQGSYTSGKHSAYLTYAQLGDKADEADSGAQALAARYNYSLSKQSTAYVEGRYVWNEENASYGPTDNMFDYVGTAGENTGRLMAGVKTRF